MTFLEKLQMIERLDQLIRLKATGNARELAKKLDISKSSTYKLIDFMRLLGADISYCEQKRSFYYETNKVFSVGFEASSKVKGGIFIKEKYQCPVFLDNYCFSLV